MGKMFPDLEASAKSAYERGRIRLGASRALAAVALTLGAVALLGAPLSIALPLGAALTLVFGYTQYRGQSIGRGGRLGLGLGVLPFAVPWMVRTTGLCMLGGSCAQTCMTICVLLGCASGASVVAVAGRDPMPHGFALGAGLVLILSAGLGCTAVGLGELIGVFVGLALVAPVYAWRVARSE